ncbi:hypothetical protein KRP22_005428 [Phytophthora ramorum]|nr:hypothetical protein KRP22_3441 [Phytophthora ramorum]
MDNMFASYNKTNDIGALVGNWVEEDALRDRTGYSRRKIPAPYFAPDRKESRIESTLKRVIFHEIPKELNCNSHASEITPPLFETTLQASHRYADYAAEKPGPGPRSSLRDQYLAETAARLLSQQRQREREEEDLERRESARTTVTKSSFLPLDTGSLLATKRVPRGRNGSLARQVDSKIQHLTKAQTDSIDQMKLELLQGAPVTRYSYAMATGIGLDYPTTVSDGNNAFGRSSTFTNEINDSSKRHGEATEPGCMHDERIGASVHQRSALKRFLNLLKAEPETAQCLLGALRHGLAGVAKSEPQQEEEREYIELHEFRLAFTATGASLPATTAVRGLPVNLTDKEVIHIFMFFDADNIGAIQLAPFVDYCVSQGEKQPFTSQ